MEFKPTWLAKDGSIYDYYFDTTDGARCFKTWSTIVQPYAPQPIGPGAHEIDFGQIFVETTKFCTQVHFKINDR
jgi:hypothetical protein